MNAMDALVVANGVRVSNARLAREITDLDRDHGEQQVAQLLDNPEGAVGAFPIGRLLMCIRDVGEERMSCYLRHAGIFSTTKRVRALTARQRHALAAALRDRTLVFPWCWR